MTRQFQLYKTAHGKPQPKNWPVHNYEHKTVLPSIQQMKMKAPKGNFLVIFDWFHCKLSLLNVSLLKLLVTIIIKKTEFWLNIAPFNAEFFQLLKQQFTKLRCRRFFTYEDCCCSLSAVSTVASRRRACGARVARCPSWTAAVAALVRRNSDRWIAPPFAVWETGSL